MGSQEDELGQLIGKNIQDTKNLNQAMSHSSGEDTNIIFPTNTQEVIEIAARTKTRQIGTAFVLGHPANGVLGTSALGVGTRGDFVTNRVICPENTFKEWFPTTDYQNTGATTCTVVSADEEASFTTGEVYQTSIIYKNSADILNATPTIRVRGGSNTININTAVPSQQMDIYAGD